MIPIQNIYYMLSYAFQVLQEQGYRSVAAENFQNTADLCAAILERVFPLSSSVDWAENTGKKRNHWQAHGANWTSPHPSKTRPSGTNSWYAPTMNFRWIRR